MLEVNRTFKLSSIPHPYQEHKVPLLDPTFKKWDLEIGSGSGQFSLGRAQQYSHRQIIAIEKTRNKVKKIMSDLDRPENLWVIHSNAVWWVTHFIPSQFLDRIFILYPNIYLKKKQANLRWVNRPFMKFLLDRLKIEGRIEIRTNDLDYHKEAVERFEKQFPFMECYAQEEIPKRRPETGFEKKYLPTIKCWRLEYIRLK